jgi:hypothetical protein
MRDVMLVVAVALFSAMALPSAQGTAASKDPIVGSWAGTYDGDDTGKFTMSISRDAAKQLGGTLQAMSDDGGNFSATFKSIVVDGSKVAMAYDSPGDGGVVTTLDATLDGTTLKGTWKSVDSSGNVVASGGFTGAKQ